MATQKFAEPDPENTLHIGYHEENWISCTVQVRAKKHGSKRINSFALRTEGITAYFNCRRSL